MQRLSLSRCLTQFISLIFRGERHVYRELVIATCTAGCPKFVCFSYIITVRMYIKKVLNIFPNEFGIHKSILTSRERIRYNLDIFGVNKSIKFKTNRGFYL